MRTRLRSVIHHSWDVRPRISTTQFQLLYRRQKLFLSCRYSRQHLASADKAEKHLSTSCWSRITCYVPYVMSIMQVYRHEKAWRCMVECLRDWLIHRDQYQDHSNLQKTKPVDIRRSLIKYVLRSIFTFISLHMILWCDMIGLVVVLFKVFLCDWLKQSTYRYLNVYSFYTDLVTFSFFVALA